MISENTIMAAEPYRDEENEVDVLAIVRMCLFLFLKYWKWFLFSTCVCMFFSILLYMRAQHTYVQTAMVLLEDTGGRGYYGGNSLDALKEMSGVRVSDKLKDEMFVLTSRRLMGKVVKELDLDVFYSTTVGLRPVSLFKVRPFTVTFDSLAAVPMMFDVEVESDGKLTITNLLTVDGKIPFKAQVDYGKQVKTPAGTIVFTRSDEADEFVGKTINVFHNTFQKTVSRYTKILSAKEYDKNANLIELDIVDTNRDRCQTILNTLLNIYKKDIVETKNTVATNTAEFIDARIGIIGGELGEVEGQLAHFKKSNNFVDFNMNARAYLEQTSESRKQLDRKSVV